MRLFLDTHVLLLGVSQATLGDIIHPEQTKRGVFEDNTSPKVGWMISYPKRILLLLNVLWKVMFDDTPFIHHDVIVEQGGINWNMGSKKDLVETASNFPFCEEM